MGLNSYVAREPRPLPVFILADVSGSMCGEKINELNLALREMRGALRSADADFDMLREFVGNSEILVIRAKDATGITKFFQWVTMSTVARMNSVNPNLAATVAPIDMDDEDIII